MSLFPAKLIVVNDVFALQDGILLFTPTVPFALADQLRLRSGDQLELRRPNGTVVQTTLFGVTTCSPSDGTVGISVNPPAPFWGSTELNTLFFLPPTVKKDQTLPSELNLGGEPVHFLWVVPLTTAECNFKLRKGFDAMLNLFQQNRHPHVFDPHRDSYV